MARRTFEKHTRAQNQTEITRVRDRFLGQISDISGNKVDPKYQLSLINQVCYDSFVKSRGGITNDATNSSIPSIPPLFSNFSNSTLFSQSGYTISASDYTFSSSDVGKILTYDDRDNANIISKVFISAVDTVHNTASTYSIAQTVTQRIGMINYALNGIYYNQYNNVYIAHIHTSLYMCSSPFTNWLPIYQVGVLGIPDSISTFNDNDNLIELTCQGIWIVDTVNNLYWQANLNGSNKLGNDNINVNGYNRNYLSTKSRFVGPYAAYSNRNYGTSNIIQHESGSQVLGSQATSLSQSKTSTTDFTQIGTDGPNGEVTGTLTFTPTIGFFAPSTNYAFGISVSGTTTNIEFTTDSTNPVTLDSLAADFEAYITNLYPDIQVIYDMPNKVSNGSIMLYTNQNYLGYLQPGTGQTDCSGLGALNGNSSAQGAVLVTNTTPYSKLFASNDPSNNVFSFYINGGVVHVNYGHTFSSSDVGLKLGFFAGNVEGYWEKQSIDTIGSVNTSNNTATLSTSLQTYENSLGFLVNSYDTIVTNVPATHYSVYATEDLNQNDVTTVGNDPNAYAFLDDIPICNAFYGGGESGQGGIYQPPGLAVDQANISIGYGNFQNTDVGRLLPVAWTYGSGLYMAWAQITQLISSSQIQVNLSDGAGNSLNYSGVLSAGTPASFWAVEESRYIIQATSEYNTITLNKIYDTCAFTTNSTNIINNNITTTIGFQVGEQVYTADGEIKTIVSIAGNILTVDSDVAVNRLSTTVAIRALPWSYLDSYKDTDISPKIGTLGLLTRFMLGIPYDSTQTFVGQMIPGFFIAGNGVNYYWSQLPNGYRYLIGDYNPLQQADKVLSPITAMSNHPSVMAIYTLQNTYQIQTNLDLDYTDTSNGTIVRVLPPATIVSTNFGCVSPAELCPTSGGLYAVINPATGDVCLFDGSTYQTSLSVGKIRQDIKSLYYRTIDYDFQYGLLIRGNNSNYTANSPYNNKMYYMALPEDFAVGQGEFQYVPLGEAGIHFIRNNYTSYMFNSLILGTITDGADPRDYPGSIYGFDYQATQDVCDIGEESGLVDYPILSSHLTTDDTGTLQNFYIEQLESHVFLSPDNNTNTDPTGGTSFTNGLIISMTAYNDIGQEVTQSSQITNNDDINFDLKVRGHRIRYGLNFNQAGWRMNGLMSYYKSCDKRTPTNSSSIEEVNQNIILNPVSGIGRGEVLRNLTTGNLLTGGNIVNSQNNMPTSITRTSGPDGNLYTALANIGSNGLFVPNSTDLTNGQYSISFWYKLESGVQDTYGILLQSIVNPGSGYWVLFSGSTLQLWSSYFIGQFESISLPGDNNWHFILLQYNGATAGLQISIDLGTPTTLPTTYAHAIMDNLLTTGYVFMPTCYHSIFDFRVYNNYPNETFPFFLQSQFQYYYNDILTNNGNRVLTLV